MPATSSAALDFGEPPTEGLTPAQLRVAELATDGLTNQQIAITLHTSLRSIEAHLTRVYREYGVRSAPNSSA